MQSLCSARPLAGTPVVQQRASQPRASRLAVKTSAIFGKRGGGVVLEEKPAPAPAAAPRGLAGLFGGRSSSSDQQTAARAPTKQQRGSSKSINKAAEYENKKSQLSRIVSALDFAETRSASDAELLYDATYGKRKPGQKLTPEQAAALRRRVVGTKADYWKDWVDVKGAYVEKGYVAKDRSATASSVPALPFLVAVVGGMVAATAYVVAATS